MSVFIRSFRLPTQGVFVLIYCLKFITLFIETEFVSSPLIPITSTSNPDQILTLTFRVTPVRISLP